MLGRQHPYDLGRSSSRCGGPFGQAIGPPVSSPRLRQCGRSGRSSSQGRNAVRSLPIHVGPLKEQYAVLMKSDLAPSGIPMLSWVPIVFEGHGGACLHRETGSSTEQRARLSPQGNSYGAATAQRFGMDCEHETRTRRSTKSDSRMDVTSARQAKNSGAGCGVCIESR
jgi:hypothetical protein